MRRLRIPEYRTRAFSPLDPADARALAATGVVGVSADLSGRTLLTTGSNVGVLTAGDVQLTVTPKLGIGRLMWLLGYAANPDGWRHSERVNISDADDLVPAMAVSFLDAVNDAFAHGVLQGYHTREESSPVLRGRLREGDQIRRRFGFPVPVDIRYDDYDIDISENRIILAATLKLLRLPGVPPRTRAGLRHIIAQLSDVTVITGGAPSLPTDDGRRTRHYRPAIDLSRIILGGHSIEQRAGPILATGFVFDLNVVFEQWLTAVMRNALRPYGGTLTGQWPDHLDTSAAVHVKPDLVWHHARRPALVADAKYKDLGSGLPATPDLYQLLAYATMLGLPSAHLIYASGSAAPRSYIIRNAGITIHTWSLDLSKPIAVLLADLDDLVSRLIETTAARGFTARASA